FAGTIVLVPFTLVYMLTQDFSPQIRDSLIAGVVGIDIRLAILPLLIIVTDLAIGIGAAVVLSAATYGIYALALALAMTEVSRATARRRAWVAVVIAGAIVQALISLAVWWLG